MKKYLLTFYFLLIAVAALAHPMPNSVVNLFVQQNSIHGEAQIPLIELANAVGDERVKNLSDPFFTTYFLEHIKAMSNGAAWITTIKNISTKTEKDPLVGTYQEVVIEFTLTPTDIRSLRIFTFNYDAVVHQVVTHTILINVKQDWRNGIQEEDDAQQIGTISMDIPTGKIFPLQVALGEGSKWTGFKSMVQLGIQHIKEGTDHLLFLLVLLLPAPLLVQRKRWSVNGGTKYSIIRILKIVTAFTIGHSITLLLGSLGWVRLPSQPVEILIAVSILVSAIHAIRPIFPGKEIYVAAGFGLVHGLAFASTLRNLNLDAGSMALSILGFNIGIELMQLFVIAISFPWLIVLSRTKGYHVLRIVGALLAGIAAIAWILQRISNQDNFLTTGVEVIAAEAKWIVFGLAAIALASFSFRKSKKALLS